MNKLCFYVKDFCYLKTEDEIELSFIPALMRRKLSKIDKFALSSMKQVYTKNIEEIVFASKSGEVERLDKIIQQYQELDEVSPAQFSGSVHNYPVGFFCLLNKINIPYYALSSGSETFQSGLVKSVLSDKNNVLLTYADDFSFSAYISKTEGKVKLELEKVPNFDEFIKILGETFL